MPPPSVEVEREADGTVRLRSQLELKPLERSVPHLLRTRAEASPERTFLAQRRPEGDWRKVSYAEFDAQMLAVAAALLDRNLGPDRPLMILAGNGIEHVVLTFGAMTAGVPVCPVSTGYGLTGGAFAKLRWVFDLVRPGLVFVDDASHFGPALSALDLDGVEVVSITPDAKHQTTSWARLARIETPPTREAIDRALGSLETIDHESVAKVLFTSGSTGMPKAVVQTQRVLTAAIASREALRTSPDPDPVQDLQWLPFSHISAGNVILHQILAGGGTYFIDDGRPMPGLFDTTLQNLRELPLTEFGTAPIGFSMLATALEQDSDLRSTFFSRLERLVYGGAAMGQEPYERMQELAVRETGHRIPFLTMFGSTETQGVSMVHWPTDRVGFVGLPMPGVELKLVPVAGKLEIRARGPMVTPGYLGDSEATSAAFDEEGYFRLGDAVRFFDPDRPERGLLFDGRLGEDFKLATGTWVSNGSLRTRLLSATAPYLRDVVVCGHDAEWIGVLAWCDLEACRGALGSATRQLSDAGLLRSNLLRDAIREGLLAYNTQFPRSSTRVRRVLLLEEPPSIDHHEITDKQYVNQRAVRERRSQDVEALYADTIGPRIIAEV